MNGPPYWVFHAKGSNIWTLHDLMRLNHIIASYTYTPKYKKLSRENLSVMLEQEKVYKEWSKALKSRPHDTHFLPMILDGRDSEQLWALFQKGVYTNYGTNVQRMKVFVDCMRKMNFPFLSDDLLLIIYRYVVDPTIINLPAFISSQNDTCLLTSM